jgi:hypothetical protein
MIEHPTPDISAPEPDLLAALEEQSCRPVPADFAACARKAFVARRRRRLVLSAVAVAGSAVALCTPALWLVLWNWPAAVREFSVGMSGLHALATATATVWRAAPIVNTVAFAALCVLACAPASALFSSIRTTAVKYPTVAAVVPRGQPH